jgi:hypothetical protein
VVGMTRSLLMLVLAASIAAAQSPVTADTLQRQGPVQFRTERDINGWPVRVRPSHDSLAPWRYGTARRLSDFATHQVNDSLARPLLGPAGTRWRAEVKVNPAAVRRHHTNFGMATGAFIGGMVIAAISMREKTSADGPSGITFFVLAPVATLGGALLGGIIGNNMPAGAWQRVAR